MKEPAGYYGQAIRAIVGRLPPKGVVPRHVNSYRELTDAQLNGLQDWCCQYARPWWATGESIIDAAELLVARAFENGNIEVTAIGDHHGKGNTQDYPKRRRILRGPGADQSYL